MNHFDVIIIGTGAGGGTLAWKLAPTGKRILVLERGGYLPREKENWSTHSVVLEDRYTAKEAWLDKDGGVFHPGIHYYVGGNTKFYGSALLRFRREDFGELRHHGGISPAWPVSYEDFEPYYTDAEHLYDVHGQRGEDPTGPPASKPYLHPPVSHEPRIQKLSDDLTRIGHHPFHLPIGIRLNESDRERSKCIRCSTCDGFPCLVDAKSDAHVTCVRPALEHPNVTLMTHAMVTKLETSPSGREVTGVVVERNGSAERYTADVVAVACGAINSAVLFLRSANEKHPGGLANGSGLVGRNYMCHNNSVVLAVSLTPNPTVFQKTIAVNDFYFGSDAFAYPMGHISMVGKFDVNIMRAGAPSFAPGTALEQMAAHSLDFWLTSEDLPEPENRVLVNDRGGITLQYTENNLEGHQRLTARLKSMLSEIGCDNVLLPCNVFLGKKIPLQKTAHQCGTMKFGADPKSSVLDVNCKTHEVDNLYVVDSSFFPSSSAVNPALTIMANALRVGDHIRERLA